MSNIFDTEDSKPDRSMAVARAARKKNGQTWTAEVAEQGNDRYGRTIGRVSCAHVDANSEQARRGMAWVFDRYAAAGSPLYALQAEAHAAMRGLCQDAKPVPPWEWRRR